jgi:hypothetical protein
MKDLPKRWIPKISSRIIFEMIFYSGNRDLLGPNNNAKYLRHIILLYRRDIYPVFQDVRVVEASFRQSIANE